MGAESLSNSPAGLWRPLVVGGGNWRPRVGNGEIDYVESMVVVISMT